MQSCGTRKRRIQYHNVELQFGAPQLGGRISAASANMLRGGVGPRATKKDFREAAYREPDYKVKVC